MMPLSMNCAVVICPSARSARDPPATHRLRTSSQFSGLFSTANGARPKIAEAISRIRSVASSNSSSARVASIWMSRPTTSAATWSSWRPAFIPRPERYQPRLCAGVDWFHMSSLRRRTTSRSITFLASSKCSSWRSHSDLWRTPTRMSATSAPSASSSPAVLRIEVSGRARRASQAPRASSVASGSSPTMTGSSQPCRLVRYSTNGSIPLLPTCWSMRRMRLLVTPIRPDWSAFPALPATKPSHAARLAFRLALVGSHGVEDQSLRVDERTSSAADDVTELRNADHGAATSHAVEQHRGCRQVESLSEGWRRDRYLHHVRPKEALDLTPVWRWERPMMDNDAEFQALKDGVLLPEPLGANSQGRCQVGTVWQQRREETLAVKCHDFACVRLHRVPLRAEDQHRLLFLDELRSRSEDQFLLAGRELLLPLFPWWLASFYGPPG